MIYLIQVFGKDNVSLLKIGYSKHEDIKKNKRLKLYYEHNPLTELIHTIPDATSLQERRLHQKFKHLSYNNHREWFYYSEDIVNYIKSVTLEELNTLSDGRVTLMTNRQRLRKVRDFSLVMALSKKLIDECISDIESKIIKFTKPTQVYTAQDIYNEFNLTKEDIKFIEDNLDKDFLPIESNDLTVINILKEFYSFSRFSERMRCLCTKSTDIDSNQLELILRQIPTEYGRYYKLLGPGVIKTCNYEMFQIERRLSKNNLIGSDELADLIYQEFKEGEKLSSTRIKEKLSSIYSKVGLKKGLFATDLENYFELKNYTGSDPLTGKRLRGFKLIKKLK